MKLVILHLRLTASQIGRSIADGRQKQQEVKREKGVM